MLLISQFFLLSFPINPIKSGFSKSYILATTPTDVTVKDAVAQISAVKQTASNAFTATFTADASKITKDDITVAAADGSSVCQVKTVELSADKLSANVTIYNNLKDATEYKVSYKDSSASFKASVGEVTGITITTTSAQLNVKTPIKYVLTDAAGIDVTPNVDTKAKCIVKVEGNYSTAELADASDAYITMTNMGDVAKVTVSYDNGAKDFTPVSATGEIKCVAAEAIKAAPVFVAAGTASTDVKVNDKSDCAKFYLGLSDKVVSVEEDADVNQVYFCATDANGDVVSYDSYEVEVANEDIASATVSTSADNGKYAIISVHGNIVGSTSLNITASKNNAKTSYVIPVTVTKKLVAVKMTVDVSRPTMSNACDSEYKSTITPKLFDELGNELTGNYTYEITNNGATKQASLSNSAGANVDFTAGEATAKTYTVKVTGSDNKSSNVFERNVSITVQALSDKAYTSGVPMTYAVEIVNKALDENSTTRKSTAKLYAMCDGKFAGYVRNDGGIKIGDQRSDHKYATADANTAIDSVNVGAKYGTLAFQPGTLVSGNVVSGSAIDTAFVSYTDTSTAAFTCVDTTANGGRVIYKTNDYSSLAKLGTYTVEFRLHYKDVNGNNNPKNTSKDADDNKFAVVTNTFTVSNTVVVPTVKVESRSVDSIANYIDKLSTNVDMNNNTSSHESISQVQPTTGNETPSANGTKVTVKNVIVTDERVNDNETWNFYIPINATFTQK